MNKEERESYDKLIYTINLLQEQNTNQQRLIKELETQIEQYKFEQEMDERR